jgi:large subunit ribosomal protein L6
MSRIGKQPIKIKDNVEISIEGDMVLVKGPKGELSLKKLPSVAIEVKEGEILVSTTEDSKAASAFWGLTRSLINNMVEGVVNGYEKKLQIEGVGFKVELRGDKLVMALGFSHPVEFEAPSGVKFEVEKNIITIFGIDKVLVGQVAANIRKLKKPEPYKGKGIRYQGEVIRRKAGKKAASA